MAIILKTNNPKTLLAKVKKAAEEDVLKTWSVDDDGDFFHNREQWSYKGWLRPSIVEGFLRFGFVGNSKIEIKKDYFSHIQGRFTGMLINNFSEHFDLVTTTSKPHETIDLIEKFDN